MRKTRDYRWQKAWIVLAAGDRLIAECRFANLAKGAATAFMAICLAALSLAQDAPPGALRIRVIDQDWDVPLEGATVQIVETGKKTVAGEDGNALFETLPGGAYTVVVNAPGFERKVLSQIVVVPGDARSEEVRLNGAFTDMDEFVVKDIDFGGGASDLKQLEIRSQHSSLMDAVGGDMMSKAGAGTAAAALRLVTGASIQDGKYAVIRGLGDRYTATLVNGVRMPTADKDKRAIQMDQFPSSMIESIQVTKTFMPDQQGDASGGINIVTKSVPDGPVLKASVSSEYDTNATGEKDFKSYRNGGNDFGGMRIGSLRFWDGGSSDKPRGTREVSDPCAGTTKTVPTERYSSKIESSSPPANSGAKFAVGDSVTRGDWTFGALLTGSYSQKYKYRDGMKYSLEQNADAKNVKGLAGEGGKTYVETSTDEQLWSTGLALGAKSENHEVKFTTLYTHQSRDVVDLRHGPKGASNVTTNDIRSGRNTIGKRITEERTRTLSSVMQYTENENGSFQLAGKHTVPQTKDTEIDWTAAYNVAESIEPDRRSIKGDYTYRRVQEIYNPGRPETPTDTTESATSIDEYERRWQDTREEAWQGQVNVKQPYSLLSNEGYFKTGVFGDFMDRTYRNRVYSIVVPESLAAADEYDYSGFGELDQLELPELDPKSIEYDGRQELTAYYAMLKAPLPEWVELTGGARFENTLMRSLISSPVSDKITLYYLITEENAQSDEERANAGRIGFRSNVDPKEANAEIDQLDVLPAAALNFRLPEDVSLRFAYGQTIARPTFKELTPVLYQDFDASRVFLGNPDLQMSNLNNYDARIEWRPGRGVDLIAASVFYKTITDPIQYSTRRDTQAGALDYIYPENYGDAEIEGVELEARKGLAFIWSDLKDFSVGGNMTLQNSAVEYPDDIREKLLKAHVYDDTRPMDGQAEILGNLNLMYENEPSGFSAGLFYNLKGETYVSGDTATDDTYVPSIIEKPVGTLDLMIGLKFAKVWRLGLEFKNLLDPDIETIYRTPYRDIPNTTYKMGRIYGMSLGCEW